MFLFCLWTLCIYTAIDMRKGTWTIHYRCVLRLRMYKMLTTFHTVEGSSNDLAPTAFLEYGFPSTRRTCHRISMQCAINVGVAILVDVRNANSAMGQTFEPPITTYTWNYRFFIRSYVHWLVRTVLRSARRVACVWRQLICGLAWMKPKQSKFTLIIQLAIIFQLKPTWFRFANWLSETYLKKIGFIPKLCSRKMHKTIRSHVLCIFESRKKGSPMNGQQSEHSLCEGVVYYGLPSNRSTCSSDVENMHSSTEKCAGKCGCARAVDRRALHDKQFRPSATDIPMSRAECEECTFYTFSLIWSVDRTIPQWKSMLFRALSGRDRIGKCSKLDEWEKGRKRASFLYTCRRRHKECWLAAFSDSVPSRLPCVSVVRKHNEFVETGKTMVWAFCLKLLNFPNFVEIWKFFNGFSNSLPLS